jgi:imidazolonepropionase-like amidohydrolase
MSKNVTLLLVALCFTAKAQNNATTEPQSNIYINHVAVIDTETGKEATDQTVGISDGKIADVANSESLPVPASARSVDGRGKYLIPGLWDMHVHRTEYESTYPMYLANGVTGVREMAGPQDAKKFRADLAAGTNHIEHLAFRRIQVNLQESDVIAGTNARTGCTHAPVF